MKWSFLKINEMKDIHINVIINEKHFDRNIEKTRERKRERERERNVSDLLHFS